MLGTFLRRWNLIGNSTVDDKLVCPGRLPQSTELLTF
jgi:hypothetical protein